MSEYRDVSKEDPLLQLVTFHEGDAEWHDGTGWYYTINDYPDEGSCGAFEKFSEAMDHAEESMFDDLPKKSVCLECNGTRYNEIDSHGTKVRCVCTYEIGDEILGRR